jgi:small subunit ribosomal protein S3
MGQKVNPVIFRIPTKRNWNSIWYAKEKFFNLYLIEDYNIRNYIKTLYGKNIIDNVKIERLQKKCIITLFTSKPGAIIGKKGNEIDVLKKKLKTVSQSEIIVNISEIKRSELSATLVAEGIAQQIEKRVSHKKAMKRAISLSMKSGALGIKILCSGRLSGAEIARSEGYKEGRIPLHTIRSNIDFALAEAKTAYGVLGIKVWLFNNDEK